LEKRYHKNLNGSGVREVKNLSSGKKNKERAPERRHREKNGRAKSF